MAFNHVASRNYPVVDELPWRFSFRIIRDEGASRAFRASIPPNVTAHAASNQVAKHSWRTSVNPLHSFICGRFLEETSLLLVNRPFVVEIVIIIPLRITRVKFWYLESIRIWKIFKELIEFWKNYYGYKNATSEAYTRNWNSMGRRKLFGEILVGNKNFYFIYFRELIIFQLFSYCYYYIYIFFMQLTRKFDVYE